MELGQGSTRRGATQAAPSHLAVPYVQGDKVKCTYLP